MAKPLEGDRKRLGQDRPTGVGLRAWLALAVILAGIALAVWRHFG